jgi:replicative DNA helicase
MNLPHDTELEGLIIGSVLMKKKLSPFEKGIAVTEFFSLLNQQIWGAILEFDENNEPIEILDVVAKVDNPMVTGSMLSKMAMGLPFGDVRFDDIKRLKDLATCRRMIHSFRNVAQKASDKEPITDIIEEAQSVLDTLKNEQDARTGTSQTLIEVMEYDVFPRLDKFVSGELVKIPFGFEKLDTATNGGASIGELVVFGAKPKSGKSVLMLQIARHIASLGLGTLVASLEMLNYENGFRFLAQSSKYSVNVFRPDMRDFVSDGLKAHAREHYNLPLYFDQKARTTRAIGKEIQRLKDSVGISACFVDYVQLLRNDKRSSSRVERIEEAIFDLKEMAMKHEIVVYTAAQFNREGIKSDKPTLADFDGASAIEKTANLGLFWVLEQDFDSDSDGRKGEMWIELGRSVAADKFEGLVFHGKDARFTL